MGCPQWELAHVDWDNSCLSPKVSNAETYQLQTPAKEEASTHEDCLWTAHWVF